MTKKYTYIFAGGTNYYVRNHLALSAPAYGHTGRVLKNKLDEKLKGVMDVHLELTKMAGGYPTKVNNIPCDTNEDIEQVLKAAVDHPTTKIVIMSCALTDFTGSIVDSGHFTPSGKYEPRLESREQKTRAIIIEPAKKLLPIVRQLPNSNGIVRKDIFLVAFKTTCGATKQEMYLKGLKLLKENSCNLVLVNDTVTRWNMIVTPEEAAYPLNEGAEPGTHDRMAVLEELAELIYFRSQLTFTQSTVVAGTPVAWSDSSVPESIRRVVDHCVSKNAYKPFQNATVGHFAIKLNDTTFLTSIRKSNFNELYKIGLVKVETDGPDTVLAYGAKPSVGGQSQRTVFRDHQGYDCIVHFHCNLRDGISLIPTVSQREVECGSHECGRNTSRGLKEFQLKSGTVKAVHLKQHGPNIVFNKDIDPNEVIEFIETNWDLESKTGGYRIS